MDKPVIRLEDFWGEGTINCHYFEPNSSFGKRINKDGSISEVVPNENKDKHYHPKTLREGIGWILKHFPNFRRAKKEDLPPTWWNSRLSQTYFVPKTLTSDANK